MAMDSIDYISEKLSEMLRRLYLQAGEDDWMNDKVLEVPNMMTKDGTPIRKLFVGNLAERTTHGHLTTLFSRYGDVESCYLKRNEGRRKNYAFVTFKDVTGAFNARLHAIQMRIQLHNRNLRVEPAESWHQPEHDRFHEDVMQDHVQTDSTDCEINMLNDDCLVHIFLYLPIADRISIERVCKRWRAISRLSWRSVKTLNLLQTRWGIEMLRIDAAILRKVLLRCGRFLNEISLTPALDFNPSTLSIIGKLCPNLQILNARDLYVSYSSLCTLSANCHNITSISLGSISSTIRDADLTELFKANPNIRVVRIDYAYIRGECFMHLSEEKVEEICLRKCLNLCATKLPHAIARFKNLKVFIANDCDDAVWDVLVAISTECKNLKTLSWIVYRNIQCFDENAICRFQELESLNLSFNPNVTNDLLIKLSSSCRQLKHLNLTKCEPVTEQGVIALTNLPHLETLILNDIPWRKNRLIEIMHQDFAKLKHLECQWCDIYDEDLGYLIKRSPQLEHLDLSCNPVLTHKGLAFAMIATSARKNQVLLKIYAGNTNLCWERRFVQAETGKISNLSPFLQILMVDLTSVRQATQD